VHLAIGPALLEEEGQEERFRSIEVGAVRSLFPHPSPGSCSFVLVDVMSPVRRLLLICAIGGSVRFCCQGFLILELDWNWDAVKYSVSKRTRFNKI